MDSLLMIMTRIWILIMVKKSMKIQPSSIFFSETAKVGRAELQKRPQEEKSRFGDRTEHIVRNFRDITFLSIAKPIHNRLFLY